MIFSIKLTEFHTYPICPGIIYTNWNLSYFKSENCSTIINCVSTLHSILHGLGYSSVIEISIFTSRINKKSIKQLP